MQTDATMTSADPTPSNTEPSPKDPSPPSLPPTHTNTTTTANNNNNNKDTTEPSTPMERSSLENQPALESKESAPAQSMDATSEAPTTASAVLPTTNAATATTAVAATVEPKKWKKKKLKKRKLDGEEDGGGGATTTTTPVAGVALKKPGPRKGKKKKDKPEEKPRKKKKKSAAHAAVQDMMRNFLEEDKYSHQGSIVHLPSDSEEEWTTEDAAGGGGTTTTGGGGGDGSTIWAITSHSGGGRRSNVEISPLRLDRKALVQAKQKRLRMELVKGTSGGLLEAKKDGPLRSGSSGGGGVGEDHPGRMVEEEEGTHVNSSTGPGRKKKRKKGKRGAAAASSASSIKGSGGGDAGRDALNPLLEGLDPTCTTIRSGNSRDDTDLEEQGFGKDESSIFGQTQGSKNVTWVQCDKCKKWRRIRGVVDSKKLPPKWYCSMNRGDPERAKCSAPEEEYDSIPTPESITDQRARKHLRLWVRRLKCNESYEARQPTVTRNKKRPVKAKEPYEWVRCCNPSCGKWRAILKSMDAHRVMESAKNGEWYCVMNTWDEKTASCAAPQENLPAIGCPPWVLQN